MASEANQSVEKKVSRAELKKQIGMIIDKEIGKLILTDGFVARLIWLGDGSRKDKLSATAELIVKKIEGVNTDEEYKKIRGFLAKFNKGNFSIRNKEGLRVWVVASLTAPVEYSNNGIGEIILQPGNYSREDFLKLVKSIMDGSDVYNPGLWVEEFVVRRFVTDGVFVVESIEKLKGEVSDFIEDKRRKIDVQN
jgi:hypothetical protein